MYAAGVLTDLDLDAASLAARVTEFWTNVHVGRPNECWPWTGYCDDDGYGRFHLLGKMRPAHELALTFTTGEVRIAGLDTCHGCHNPPCCNPGHLRFDTRASNVADMVSAGRAAFKGGVKLTDEDVRIIRERRAAGAQQQALADQYGVSNSLISMLVKGKRRLDAGGPIATERVYRKKD